MPRTPRVPGSFRMKSQLQFLTYAQCAVPLDIMLQHFKKLWGPKYGWCVISAEDHEPKQDDDCVGVHRHVMIELNKACDISNCRFPDITYEGQVYHAKWEPAKTKAECLDYTIKHGDYIIDGIYKGVPFSIEAYKEANKTKTSYSFQYVATLLKKGDTMKILVDTVPGFVLQHKRKIEEYIVLLDQLYPKELPKFPGFQNVPLAGAGWQEVVEWANINFLEKRSPKQKQLWLWSNEGDIGKSWPWMEIMKQYKRMYLWDYGDKQGPDVINCEYILMDDFGGQCTVHFMKVLSQMMGVPVDIKYGNKIQWMLNVPLIVTTNRPPHEVYTKCNSNDVQTLKNRFEVIQVQDLCYLAPKTPPLPQDQVLVPGTPQPPSDDKDDIDEHMWSSEDSGDSEWTVMEKLRQKKTKK
nr:MAG: replication associated protein [Cressdnaviricota sp.]